MRLHGSHAPATAPSNAQTTIRRCGAGMALLLAAAVTFYAFPSLTGHRVIYKSFNCLLAVGLLGCYLRGHQAFRSGPDGVGIRTIVWMGACLVLLAALIVPFHSTDLFSYVNTGWLQARYHANPYLTVVADIPDWSKDPMLGPDWVFTPPPYGFLFVRLTHVLCAIGGGHFFWTTALFKATNVLAIAACALVLALGCNRLTPTRTAEALFHLLWNPLLLIHALGNGHNDILMALGVALGLYAVIAGRSVLVMPALMGAVLVKVAAAVLVPFVFCYMVRRWGWSRTLQSCILSLLVFAALAFPYLKEIDATSAARLAPAPTRVHNSIPSMVIFPFEVLAHYYPEYLVYEPHVYRWLRGVFGAGFLCLGALLAIKRLRSRRYATEQLLWDCVLVQFVLLCIVSPQFYAWYIGMFLPVALWLPIDSKLRNAVLAVAGAEVFSVTLIGQAHFLNALVMLVVPMTWVLVGWRPPAADDPRRPQYRGRRRRKPSRRSHAALTNHVL